jgi:metal-responsive CopG/Arc/MetJ family transcriptional regulator
MERVAITIDDHLLASVVRLAASRGYPSRSEAIRELSVMQQCWDAKRGSAMCVAALSYVFDHFHSGPVAAADQTAAQASRLERRDYPYTF